MITTTHLLISNVLYSYLYREQGFKINRLAFMYGCIKPDFNNEDLNCEHTIDESLNSMSRYSEKFMYSMSLKNFSVSLGIACHFICDYFCLYHNGEYKRKNMVLHFLYEVMIHYKFLSLILLHKLSINNYKLSKQNLKDILLEMHEKYNQEQKSLTKDITYALSAAVVVAELIICFSEIKFEGFGAYNYSDL